MSDFVLDASALIVLVLDDEPTAPVVPILEARREGRPVVPRLWEYEVASALAAAYRRGRADDSDVRVGVNLARRLDVQHDSTDVDAGALFDLAMRHDVTPYDASYLRIALTRDIPLATVDRRLAGAARAAGVPLIV